MTEFEEYQEHIQYTHFLLFCADFSLESQPAAPLIKKVPVLFGVFEKPLYYPTKRENKIKISEISVYFTFCWFVGIKEKNIRRSIGKNFSSPWRETAGRKGILICLVSEKRAETAASIALLVEAGEARTPRWNCSMDRRSRKRHFFRASIDLWPKFRICSFVPLVCCLLGLPPQTRL